MSATHYLEPAVRDRTLSSLAESLGNETQLLTSLADILRDQRAGVARDDVETVDDSVHAAHRVMQTLTEARRHRNALVHLLTDQKDISLSGMARALGTYFTDQIRTRRDELEAAARAVSAEVALNRAVLTEAIDTGNDYVRRLVSPQTGGYGGRGEWAAAQGQPALINRRV